MKYGEGYYKKKIKDNRYEKIIQCFKIVLREHIQRVKNNKFGNVLDIGCATGGLLAEFAKVYEYSKLIGVDYGAIPQRDFALKENPKAMFLNLDLETVQESKITDVDLVFCMEVIEHIENFEGVVKFINNMLMKGGLVVFSSNNGRGRGHVSCHPENFWIDLFMKYRIMVNSLDSVELRGEMKKINLPSYYWRTALVLQKV